MSKIVETYNPANAESLTSEQLEGLRNLTSAEIKELAMAYPNMTMQKAYLLIIDGSKPAEKQLPTLSSFENLYNLREKNGLRNYVAYAFKAGYKPRVIPHVKGKVTEVIDLSEKELMDLPGFKTRSAEIEAEKVEVTKIRKKRKSEVDEN